MIRQRTFLAVGLLVALVLAGLVSGAASSAPDGLEKVAVDKGFESTASEHGLGGSPVADYHVAGVDDERVSTGLAGVLGVVMTLAVGGGLFVVLRRRGASAGSSGSSSGAPSSRTEPSGAPSSGAD